MQHRRPVAVYACFAVRDFSGKIDFGANISDLLRVKNLQSLTLDKWEPASDDSLRDLDFDAFVNKMVQERPNAKFCVKAGLGLQTE